MVDDARIQQLLDELYDQQATPEEVCRSCPELLPMVRNRWLQMCRVRANLDMLFPPCDAPTLREPEQVALPQIPGYEVEAVLGRGGMGIVFRARHLRLNRTVALKMLLAGAYAGPKERERFLREAEAVAGLRHPNIVQVHDLREHDGRPYFTMEYVEGGSLVQKLEGTPRCVGEGAALLATLAQAVQVAHQGGIVHRDLKPANVLLTADGTPKISDFGLARRLEGAKGLTQSGIAIGTPSYMAPEQAQGQTKAIGPAVDVYALGAILYEMVTGRPPFKGETAAATLQQVVTQDPVPPSRLNPSVPRDLETICLKCLHKEPQRRYASAAALAEDLKRFAEGRPILARPKGWAERFWRWSRRNPAAAAVLALTLALVGLVSGGGVWLMQQWSERQAELRNEVGTLVSQAASSRQQFHFHQARKLLEQARQRLGAAGPDDVRWQLDRSCADLDLAEGLDAARTQAAILIGGRFDPTRAEPLYASAFANAGLGAEPDDSAAVATAVRASPLRWEIVAALDDWAGITRDSRRREWLLAVARLADPDPARGRLRQPEIWKDSAKLTQLAKDLRIAELSPQLATTLSRVAYQNGGDALALLTAAQARFPQDYWLNFELGWALYRAQRWEEAIGYSRAALALRPESSAAHSVLATALYGKGQIDEAVERFHQALNIDPKSVWAHTNLGIALRDKGRVEEGVAHFRQALDIDPKHTPAHNNLGGYLFGKGDLDGAIAEFRECLRLDERPSPAAHINLGMALAAKGQMDETIEHFQQAVRLDPESPTAQTGLGFYLYVGAQAALLDATGQGSKKERPAAPEQARLRRKALGRLRASLDQAAKLVNAGKVLNWSLTTWQKDRILAVVRDPAELAKMPAEERDQWQRFWADVAALLAADPLEQGRALAARGEWVQAADRYARILTRGSTRHGDFWFEYAALLLLSGDRPAYARACVSVMAANGKDGGPRPYYVARVCTLAPDAIAEASQPGRLAEPELQASPREFWSLTEQGALAYRAGRFQQSVTFFEESLQANAKPGAAVLNWLWLALGNQRLGKAEEARRWLGKAQSWLDQYSGGMPAHAEEDLGLHFHNWLEAHVLRREAEALIRPTGP
jgi:tetratricopeptide (TPR) repeat protein